MVTTDEDAARIQRCAEDMGLGVVPSQSLISPSRYLDVTLHTVLDEDGDLLPGHSVRIRVSDHPLPLGHGIENGFPDFEVGDHAQSNGDWLDAVIWLSQRSGRPLPPEVAALAKQRRAPSA